MPRQNLLLQITIKSGGDLNTVQSIGKAIAQKRAIGGVWCERDCLGTTLSFFDCYAFENISISEKARHLVRKIGAAVFGNKYMNRVIITR